MKNLPVLGRESCPLAQGPNGHSFWTQPEVPYSSRATERWFLALVRMCIAEHACEGWYTKGSEVNGWYGFMDNFCCTGWFVSSNLLPLKRHSFPFSLRHVYCVAEQQVTMHHQLIDHQSKKR